jgi:hypothetical protein
MLPFNIPRGRPAVLTDTVKLPGAVMLAGDTESQEFPEVTAAFTVAEPLAPTLSIWEAGAEPPIAYVKLREAGALSVARDPERLSVTGIWVAG